jgi:hypothetical protein
MNKVEKGKYYASLARKAMHLSIKNENWAQQSTCDHAAK